MNQKTLKIILILASLSQSVLWIAGLILANVGLVIAAIIIVIAIIPLFYINREDITAIFQRDKDKIGEDERTQMINEKSSTVTLGVFIGTIIYVGLILVALRNVYPQYLVTGYVLLITALFGLIISIISLTYYKRRF